MLTLAHLRNCRPLVATPCYGGSVFVNYVSSVLDFARAAGEVGMKVEFYFRSGDSLVTRSRNDCVAYFLAHKVFTHLFWIDADIGFTATAAFRLFLYNRNVTAGIYPLKHEFWPKDGVAGQTTRAKFEELYAGYPVTTGSGAAGGKIDADGFMKVTEAPTGFMVIQRGVFDQLIAKYPDLKYVPDNAAGSQAGENLHYRFFDVMTDPASGRYLSEDFAFCRRWEAIGGEIFVDANSNLTHYGNRLYTGDFGASLRAAANAGKEAGVSGLENLRPNPRREGS